MDCKILFAFLPLVSAIGPERVACDGVIFHDAYFNKELLFGDLGRPYNLMLHRFSGLLFFSHTVQNGSHLDFRITSCHLIKKVCRDIDGVGGGYAIAHDAGNDDIYFGGHDGIYKYNYLTRSAEFFAEKGKSIWGLFVKRHFYYIEYPTQKLYVYQNDEFVQVAESTRIEIDNFFISRHNDIYFSNKTALYKVAKPHPDVIVLDDNIAVRQIVEDGYGDVYFVGSDGIHLEDKPYHRVKKVADIDQAFGLAFDENDGIIYSDKDAIYRLYAGNYTELCHQALLAAQKADRFGRVTSDYEFKTGVSL